MKNLITIYLKKIFYKGKVVKYLKSHKSDSEKLEVFRFLKKKPYLVVFPYNFIKKYKTKDIKVYENGGMNYINYFDKKLYIKKSLNKKAVSNYCKSLFVEQDIMSPHKYTDENFYVEEGSVLFDLGVAEGNFSLENIDKCKKVYLFEPEEDWIKCLKQTFKSYSDKTVITQKFVSDKTSNNTIKLDDFINEINENDKVFIKMDIEGFEISAIKGMKRLINKCKNLKIAVCCYHNQSDETKIRKEFSLKKYRIDTSKGYMIFYSGNEFREPYLTRGVLRITKNKN